MKSQVNVLIYLLIYIFPSIENSKLPFQIHQIEALEKGVNYVQSQQ